MSVPTPLIYSPFISKKSGYEVYLKLENTQPSGSFKLRGIGHLIRTNLSAESSNGTKSHVYSSSGGNAGLAAAYSAMLLKVPCTVCVPLATSEETCDRLRAFNAEVVKHGSQWAEADQHLREVIIKAGSVNPIYCHPFDDPIIWDGHSVMVDEIKAQLPKDVKAPACICLSVGGAGLYMGIAVGLKRHSWAASVPIIAVEPEGACSLSKSLENGGVSVKVNPNSTIKSLSSNYTASAAIDFAFKENPTKSVVIQDDQAVQAAKQFAEDHKFIVEPSCGAALAPLYDPSILAKAYPELQKGSTVIVIVCGGTAVSTKDYA